MNRLMGGNGVTPDADQSARFLADRIRRRIPTAYFRFGDGLIECLWPQPGKTNTCDGEAYTPELAIVLRRALADLLESPDVLLGDWGREPETTAYYSEWLRLRGNKARLIHFEALLLVRHSLAVMHFYHTVKQERRRKLFMGPPWNAGAARMLGAELMVVPDRDLFAHIGEIERDLENADFELLLFGAGMAGNIPVVNCWKRHPERTYINLGSAMDPLFKGRTRSNQLPPEQARTMFRELLQ